MTPTMFLFVYDESNFEPRLVSIRKRRDYRDVKILSHFCCYLEANFQCVKKLLEKKNLFILNLFVHFLFNITDIVTMH